MVITSTPNTDDRRSRGNRKEQSSRHRATFHPRSCPRFFEVGRNNPSPLMRGLIRPTLKIRRPDPDPCAPPRGTFAERSRTEFRIPTVVAPSFTAVHGIRHGTRDDSTEAPAISCNMIRASCQVAGKHSSAATRSLSRKFEPQGSTQHQTFDRTMSEPPHRPHRRRGPDRRSPGQPRL